MGLRNSTRVDVGPEYHYWRNDTVPRAEKALEHLDGFVTSDKTPVAFLRVSKSSEYGNYLSRPGSDLPSEMKRLQAMDHPNVIGVHDFVPDVTSFWFVLERFGPGTLSDVLGYPGPSRKLMLENLRQILSGLHYLHSQNPPIFHGMLQPSTILRSDSNELKIGCFGILRSFEVEEKLFRERIDGEEFVAPECRAQLKKRLSEMPPEEKEPFQASASADVFSVGVILYRMLTRRVYQDDLRRNCVRFNRKNPLSRLCISMLNVDPSLRPTVREIMCEIGVGESRKDFVDCPLYFTSDDEEWQQQQRKIRLLTRLPKAFGLSVLATASFLAIPETLRETSDWFGVSVAGERDYRTESRFILAFSLGGLGCALGFTGISTALSRREVGFGKKLRTNLLFGGCLALGFGFFMHRVLLKRRPWSEPQGHLGRLKDYGLGLVALAVGAFVMVRSSEWNSDE